MEEAQCMCCGSSIEENGLPYTKTSEQSEYGYSIYQYDQNDDFLQSKGKCYMDSDKLDKDEGEGEEDVEGTGAIEDCDKKCRDVPLCKAYMYEQDPKKSVKEANKNRNSNFVFWFDAE